MSTDLSGNIIPDAKMSFSGFDHVFCLCLGLKSPEGVAIDFVGRNMYFTDSELDFISVADLNGENQKVLHQTKLVNPRAIAVDPQRGYLFWADWNRNSPKIERSFMDGSDRRTIVSTDLGLPNGLYVETRTEQLCWADAGTRKLECVNYDGNGRQVMFNEAQYPFDLTFANDNYYWTDWEM